MQLGMVGLGRMGASMVRRLPRIFRKLETRAAPLAQWFDQQLTAHHHYIREQLQDMPSIRDWTWVRPSA
jgi:phosphoketolase